MFSEEKKADVDIFTQGDIHTTPIIRPTVLDEVKARQGKARQEKKLASIKYIHPVRFHRRLWPKPISGSIFTRYSSGRTLRQQGKERIYRTMSIAPTLHIARENGTINKSVSVIPQQPMNFPELAGFGELPVGAGTADVTSSPSVSRGLWGDLSNILTQVGQVYTTVTTQKYQTEIAKAQAEAARAKAITPFRFPFTGASVGIMSYLPWIALAGGGVLLATTLLKRKRRF